LPVTPQGLGIRYLGLLGLLGGLLIAFVAVLVLGSVDIPLRDVLRVLTGGDASKEAWTNIILKVRLPKALTASLAGAALAISGLQMQTLFRNPLADPFVLGISSGASLGVALVVLSAGTVAGSLLATISLAGDFALASAATVGAGAVMVMVLVMSRRVQNAATLLILGLMFSYMTSAVVSLLLYFSLSERIQAFINWSLGSFGGVTWGQMEVFVPVIVVGLLLALLSAKSLNALLLGDTYAQSLGLNIQAARLSIILSTSLLAGCVTAFCGPIAFIGIAIPHLCRVLFRTSDHRQLLPASLLMGAMVALLAALIAELPTSNLVLPINVVTALLGAPVVMWVILRQQQWKAW
jgi:iron complex transport system permease protein